MAKDDLNSQLERIGWAVFIIMLGVLWLYPEGTFHEDTWLIGVGAIFLLLNVIRYLYTIAVSWFTIILGLLALAAGLDNYYNVEIPVIGIIVIIFGLIILLKPKTFKGCPWADKGHK